MKQKSNTNNILTINKCLSDILPCPNFRDTENHMIITSKSHDTSHDNHIENENTVFKEDVFIKEIEEKKKNNITLTKEEEIFYTEYRDKLFYNKYKTN